MCMFTCVNRDRKKETIATGTTAAAMGGFTSVACMPNPVPSIDNVSQIQFVLIKT